MQPLLPATVSLGPAQILRRRAWIAQLALRFVIELGLMAWLQFSSSWLELSNVAFEIGVGASGSQMSKLHKEARREAAPNMADSESDDGAMPKTVH